MNYFQNKVLESNTYLICESSSVNIEIEKPYPNVTVLYVHENAVQLDRAAKTSWASAGYAIGPYFAWKVHTPKPMVSR